MNLAGSLPEREWSWASRSGRSGCFACWPQAPTRKQGSLRCRYGSGEN